MAATPEETKQRIIEYYVATTEESYLPNWAGESLGFHFGLADEHTQSLAESLLNSNAFLSERAQIGKSCRVLDAGCGVCGSAIWLAQQRGARVTGVTLVERQVQLAREFIRERGVEDLVDAEQRDMADTGFSEQTFDVVWNLESMCHVLDLDAYFEHIAFLLKDRGRFACIDLCAGPTRDQALEQIVCDGWAMAPLRSPAEIVAALSRHDFENVEVLDLTERAMLSGRALEAMASRSLLKIRAEQTFLGQTFPIYEGHVRAALAMVEGMRTGRTSVTHFLASRKQRP